MSVTYEQVFEAVDLAVQSLTYRWKTYCELFDSGAENLALLNDSGASVFALLQRLLLDDSILALSRLTDPSSSGPGKSNASFKYLHERALGTVKPETLAEAQVLLAELKNLAANIRLHRKKAVAHADLQHAIAQEVLPSLTYDELEKSMQLCRDFMLKMGTSQMYRSGGYSVIVPFGKGVPKLLSCLRAAHSGGESAG